MPPILAGPRMLKNVGEDARQNWAFQMVSTIILAILDCFHQFVCSAEFRAATNYTNQPFQHLAWLAAKKHGALPLRVLSKAVLQCFFPLHASPKVWQVQKSRVRDSCVRVKVCEALLRFWKSHEKSQVREIEIGLWDFVKPSHCTQIRFQVQSFSTSHNPSSQSSKQNSKILPAFLHQIITPNIRQLIINPYVSPNEKSSKTKKSVRGIKEEFHLNL